MAATGTTYGNYSYSKGAFLATDRTIRDSIWTSAKRHMKTKRTSTDGLGGFYDASQTLSLGAVKRIRYHRFYFFLTLIFLTWFPSPDAYDISCLSLSLSVQSCNETYKRINFRHHCSRKILIPNRNKLLTKTCIIGLFSLPFLVALKSYFVMRGRSSQPWATINKHCE